MNANKGKNKGGAKYTPLTDDDVYKVMEMAFSDLIKDEDIADDVAERYEYEEYCDRPGTFFIDYNAETWRKAEAFCAAVCGAAWALGHFAEVQTRWSDNLGDGGKRRLVSVYVAASDVIDEDGHAVA